MCRTDGNFKVSRVLLDGTTTCTFYDEAATAINDFYAFDDWPKVECLFSCWLAKEKNGQGWKVMATGHHP